MSRTVNINVSGGNANFGNVVQGDDNQVSAEQRDWVQTVEAAFATCAQDARSLGEGLGVTNDQIAALLRDVESLKAAAAATPANEDKPTLAERLKRMGSKFAWAVPVLKMLAEKIVPKVAALLF